MTGANRFGDFVLLKKLGEDALGEMYRAGEMAGSNLSKVVLLRLYSGHGIDGPGLVAAMTPRLDQLATGPGLLPARACGAVQQLAYAAHDYISGKDLPSLTRRANDGFSSLSAEHAVLIIERIAKGLALIHGDASTAGSHGVHGFVVPQLVWVSNEGEARLLGFEAGPTLATNAAAGKLDPVFAPYLSPEVRAGSAGVPADDVYGLGVLFFELLTGAPPDPEKPAGELLAGALTVADRQPLPSGLADLIRGSVAPASARISDAGRWHDRLSQFMSEAGGRATHFDLAFFMHELYRDEIHREDDELAREKTEAVQTVSPPAAAPATAATSAAGAATVSIDTASLHTEGVAAALPRPGTGAVPVARGGGNALRWIALAAALVLVAGLGYWALGPGRTAPPPTAPPPVAVPPPPPPSPIGAPAGDERVTAPGADPSTEDEEGRAETLTLEAASSELDRLVAESADALSAQLSAEYDAKIKSLQSQLEQARAVEASAQEALADLDDGPAPETASPVAEAGGVPPGNAPPLSQPPPAPAVPDAPPVEDVPVEELSPLPASETETTAPPASAEPAAPPPPPPPAAEQARPAVVVPPKIIDRPQPVYPPAARRVRKSATVIVKVLVGTDGNVESAELVSKKKVGFGIDEAALTAARAARYQPATVDGVATAQWTTLVMRFEP